MLRELLLKQLNELEIVSPENLSELLFKICEEFDIAEMDLIDYLDTLRPSIMEEDFDTDEYEAMYVKEA